MTSDCVSGQPYKRGKLTGTCFQYIWSPFLWVTFWPVRLSLSLSPFLESPFWVSSISFHIFLFSWRKLITEGKGQPALSQERVDVLFLVYFLISQGHEPGIARSDSLYLPVEERSVLFSCRLKIKMKSKGRKWFLILSHVLGRLSAYSQFCNNLVRDTETCVRILTYGRLSLIVFLQPGKLWFGKFQNIMQGHGAKLWQIQDFTSGLSSCQPSLSVYENHTASLRATENLRHPLFSTTFPLLFFQLTPEKWHRPG